MRVCFADRLQQSDLSWANSPSRFQIDADRDRGIAKAEGGDLAGAIANYNAAIDLRQAIRASMENAW